MARVRAALRTKAVHDGLAEQAARDGLTGVFNRRELDARAGQAVALADPPRPSVLVPAARHRPLQAGQRHLRPRRRRHGPARGRAADLRRPRGSRTSSAATAARSSSSCCPRPTAHDGRRGRRQAARAAGRRRPSRSGGDRIPIRASIGVATWDCGDADAERPLRRRGRGALPRQGARAATAPSCTSRSPPARSPAIAVRGVPRLTAHVRRRWCASSRHVVSGDHGARRHVTRADDEALAIARELPIDPERLRATVERLAGVGSSPLGFRTTGTPEDREVAEYAAGELRDCGLRDVAIEEVTVDGWRFEGAALEAVGDRIEASSMGGVPADAARRHRGAAGRRRRGRSRGAWTASTSSARSPSSTGSARRSRCATSRSSWACAGRSGVVANCPQGADFYQSEGVIGSFDGHWHDGRAADDPDRQGGRRGAARRAAGARDDDAATPSARPAPAAPTRRRVPAGRDRGRRRSSSAPTTTAGSAPRSTTPRASRRCSRSPAR